MTIHDHNHEIYKPAGGTYRTYIPRRFATKYRDMISRCNRVIEQYAAQGYDLTLRQLYYRMVAANIIPNSDKEYNNLGETLAAARLAGYVSWTSIVDRTRNLAGIQHRDDPADAVSDAAQSYAIDKWQDQPYRIEVWVEKDALKGVVAQACNRLDVPYFSCRGYTSWSEMWEAGQRLKRHAANGQKPLIVHLGDHDPSGKDMTRDIEDRLLLVTDGIPIERIALNMDQITQYDPPANPAKVTDSRSPKYVAEFGDSSWELDALEPSVIAALINDAVLTRRDEALWLAQVAKEQEERERLELIPERWATIEGMLYASEEAADHGFDRAVEYDDWLSGRGPEPLEVAAQRRMMAGDPDYSI